VLADKKILRNAPQSVRLFAGAAELLNKIAEVKGELES
jgi:glycerol dehydrogenase-like iron-containing ADH family enzyme